MRFLRVLLLVLTVVGVLGVALIVTGHYGLADPLMNILLNLQF